MAIHTNRTGTRIGDGRDGGPICQLDYRRGAQLMWVGSVVRIVARRAADRLVSCVSDVRAGPGLAGAQRICVGGEPRGGVAA